MSDIGSALLASIASKSPQDALAQLHQFAENMRDPAVGAAHVSWITEPANLSTVQAALTNELGVPHRLMMIRRQLMSKARRASVLMQAMELAVKRVHSL